MAERSLNRVQLIGRLGRDAEGAFTTSGTHVAKFSVATTRTWKDNQSGEYKSETDWHNCVAWRMDKVCEYLTKGKKIFVEGRLQTRSYEKDGATRYVTEVVVEQIILLDGGGSRDGGDANEEPVSRPRSAPRQQPAHNDGIGDDDVPF